MANAINAPIDLRDRTLSFSRQVIKFLKQQKALIPGSIQDQLLRSSTSIGANFTEAKSAISKRDFRSKVYISKKEAAETLYWLKLLEEYTHSSHLKLIQQECEEIAKILQSIINTLNH